MSTVSFLVIEKNGSIKEQTLKKFDEALLYKKAGFKSSEGFTCHAEWNIENINDKAYTICVYGKTSGRANQENKYEFPPPIDTTLFFGNCIVLNKGSDEEEPIGNLTQKEWNDIYDYLYGGFEELGSEEDEEEEEDEDDDVPRTKTGYAKDGFVVDDDEVEEEDDDSKDSEEAEAEADSEEEEEYIPKKRKARATKAATKTTNAAKTTKKSKSQPTVFDTKVEETYLDCTSELSEEEYV
jgi:hypothetical protein